MGSLTGAFEIVEAQESSSIRKKLGSSYQLNSVSGDNNKRLPVFKLGYKDSLEDDIDKLFESIRIPTKGSFQSQISSCPKMKNVLKNPITMDVARSQRVVNSEPVNLKKALRDLCISKASEMAATKRLSKSAYTPASSEAGRIKTLYNSVVGEGSGSRDSFVGNKKSVVHISPVPGEIKLHSSRSLASSPPPTKMTSFRQNTNSFTEVCPVGTESESWTALPKEGISGHGETLLQTTKVGPEEMEKKASMPSPAPYSSNVNDGMLEQAENASLSSKPSGKTKILKSRRRGTFQTMSSASSPRSNGDKVSKVQNTRRLVKPVLRKNHLNKKKTKQNSGYAISSAKKKVKNRLELATSELVCERCHCALENTKTEENHDFEISSHHKSSKFCASSSNVQVLGPTPIVTSTTCTGNQAMGKGSKTMQLKDNNEFSQSSKSSPGEHSSSTITSYESNVSGSGCGNRPHMSKDVRWEMISQVQMQHGILSLKNFSILRKLGCGDIGTVYLAELIGTNCLFAIKVMDNEYLARRKKMPRAQTEREILRMLDHPFLPTLYSQFTSDNLSCLVMEYCPGGDLHVLRQRQLGRSFSEPAARFFVAEVLLALEYLHMLGVVYRDLKPENILVRGDGHIMLTDFDLSLRCNVNPTLLKLSGDTDPARISHLCSAPLCIEPLCIDPFCQVSCFSARLLPLVKNRKSKPELSAQVGALPQLVAEPTDARSNSFVGTHEYLAPEIIKGEGHGAAVDWWTLGIFLYELLYGRTPFKGSNNEQTLSNIVLKSLKFPDSPFVSFQARDLIRGLLVKEPENRLGTEKGATEIKQHPFFEGLNWALIRCAVPPEIPESLELGLSEHISDGNSNCFEVELF